MPDSINDRMALIISYIQLYQECDHFQTNVVRTTALVESLSQMVGNNPNVDKDLLKELSLLLDPRGDDGYLKQDEFVETGLKVANTILAYLLHLSYKNLCYNSYV